MSSYQNMKSSAVNGLPSDHFMPRRRWTSHASCRRPASRSPCAMFGHDLVAGVVPEQQVVRAASSSGSRSSSRPGPVKPRRQVPPYLPISCTGLMTSGSWPMRSATGGSLPALTSSASCGASLNALGNCAASVTISGPSSLPMSLLPVCESALVATTPLKAATTRTAASRVRSGLFGQCATVSSLTPPLARPDPVPHAGGRLS